MLIVQGGFYIQPDSLMLVKSNATRFILP